MVYLIMQVVFSLQILRMNNLTLNFLFFPVVHVNHHHGNHEFNISMAVNCANLPSDHGYQATYDNSTSHHIPVLNNTTYLAN